MRDLENLGLLLGLTSISRISVAPRILENHFSFSTVDCKYHQFFNIFACELLQSLIK